MMKRLAYIVSAFALVALLVPAQAAWASGDEIPLLSSRYDLLQELDVEQDSSSQVITAARIGELTAVNRALDGATVSFTGEAVGDVIKAEDGYKWVNVLGASGASIGVHMSDADAAKVTTLGNYNTEGVTIEVTGVYSIACADHQGELDVHASSVTVTEPAEEIEHQLDSHGLAVGVYLCLAAVLLLALFFGLRGWLGRGERRAKRLAIFAGRKMAKSDAFEKDRKKRK